MSKLNLMGISFETFIAIFGGGGGTICKNIYAVFWS